MPIKLWKKSQTRDGCHQKVQSFRLTAERWGWVFHHFLLFVSRQTNGENTKRKENRILNRNSRAFNPVKGSGCSRATRLPLIVSLRGLGTKFASSFEKVFRPWVPSFLSVPPFGICCMLRRLHWFRVSRLQTRVTAFGILCFFFFVDFHLQPFPRFYQIH